MNARPLPLARPGRRALRRRHHRWHPGRRADLSARGMTVHGKPQLDTTAPTSRRRAPARLLVAATFPLVIGLLGAGVALGARWAGGTRPSAPAPPAPAIQPPVAPPTSIVVQPAATSACLETARRGDELVALLINNQRDRAAKLLVPYHVASRQCARDAAP